MARVVRYVISKVNLMLSLITVTIYSTGLKIDAFWKMSFSWNAKTETFEFSNVKYFEVCLS